MKIINRIVKYFSEVRKELKKVQWPSKREFIVYTGVVIFAVLLFGVIFWGLDTVFLALLRLVIKH